jgi:hypothetical protein
VGETVDAGGDAELVGGDLDQRADRVGEFALEFELPLIVELLPGLSPDR